MSSEKYIGLDVHQATIVVAVMDSSGKLVMESILETKAATILQFFAGLRGTLSVTFEEGTWAAQRRRFIQCFFSAGIAQIEPLLQKVHAQHDRQAYRRPPVLSLRIVRLDQRL
jgi:hypothetical protein